MNMLKTRIKRLEKVLGPPIITLVLENGKVVNVPKNDILDCFINAVDAIAGDFQPRHYLIPEIYHARGATGPMRWIIEMSQEYETMTENV